MIGKHSLHGGRHVYIAKEKHENMKTNPEVHGTAMKMSVTLLILETKKHANDIHPIVKAWWNAHVTLSLTQENVQSFIVDIWLFLISKILIVLMIAQKEPYQKLLQSDLLLYASCIPTALPGRQLSVLALWLI